MTTDPITETDYYGKGFAQAKANKAMMGQRVMSFGATRTDHERLTEAMSKNAIADPDPPKPEWKAWDLRPRNKNREIGPSMRFNSHLQAERMMDNFTKNTMTYFMPREVTGDGFRKDTHERQVKSYIKNGQYEIPNYTNASDDEEDTKRAALTAPISPMQKGNMFKVVPRKSKLNKANFLIEPSKVMKDLHRKTHFKAATSVAAGDHTCVKIKGNEFSDQFKEMARNLS